MKKFLYKVMMPLRGLGLSRNSFTASAVSAMNKYFRSGHPESVTISNLIFYIDPIDSLHLTIDPYEPYLTSLIERYVTSNSIFVDIGANIGYHTIFAAKRAKQVIAFEPERRNFELLQKNRKANNCMNVIAVNAAVSASEGTVNLYIAEENRGGHSMVHGKWEVEAYGPREFISIPAVTLDDYMKGDRVDFIKMDIEGAEGLALKGMLATLRKWKPIVVTEYRVASLKDTGIEPSWFLGVFADLGYSRSEISHSKEEGDKTFRNYLFVPEGKEAEITETPSQKIVRPRYQLV